jgi:putative transposase
MCILEYYQLPKILTHPVPILSDSDILRIGNERYVPAGRRLDGYRLVNEEDPEDRIFLKFDDINARIDAGTAKLAYAGASPERQYLDLLFNGRRFDEFGEDVKRIARLRERLFLAYDKECLLNGHKDRSSDGFNTWIEPQWKKLLGPVRSDSTKSISSPSVSTFNRLYKQWIKYDRNILAICPRHTGPGKRTLTYEQESLDYAITEARGFMSRLKPRKSDIFETYKASVHKENEERAAERKLLLHHFGKSKFYEIIDSFPAFDVVQAREGLEAALKKFAPNLRMYDETVLGQRIEIDEVKTDLMTVWAMAGVLGQTTEKQRKILKKIRLWIVVIVDVATRYVLAAKVAQAPNARAALETLRLMMTDKTFISECAGAQTPWIGKVKPFGTAYSDHGSAFLAEETSDAFRALGIEPTKPETGKPKKRPHIESLFHTIGPLFTQFFDGRTFRSILEKGDYDPKAHASLAAAEFSEIIIQGICDYYHNRAHGSLGGQSPHNRLVECVEGYGWMRPPDQMDMILAFGKKDTLRIGSYGIVKHGIPYNNDWLVDQHMERGDNPFEIVHDLGYLNSIVVKGNDGGWVEVENRIDLPSDLTEVEWADACKAELAKNRSQTAESYLAIRDYILRNRENGKAATLRAKLDPVEPSQTKLEKQRKQLYRNFAISPVSGAAIKPDVPVSAPADDLRGGTVGQPRPAEFQPTPMPSRKVSKFDRRRDDD